MGAALPELTTDVSHESPVIALLFKTIVLQELSRSGRVRGVSHQTNFSKRNL